MKRDELFDTADKLSDLIVGKSCQLAVSLNRDKVMAELIELAYRYIDNNCLILNRSADNASR